MNDAEYLFRQSARRSDGFGQHGLAVKKRGGVRFPSDNLTKKEIEKMSGEVKEIKLHEPISWVEFKKLPDDLAREHIEWLRDTYHISQRGLAEYWGIVQSTARIKAQALGIQWPRTYKKWARDDRERFWAWLGIAPENKKKQTETIVTPEPEPQPPCKQTRPGPFSGELRRERERDRIKAMALDLIRDEILCDPEGDDQARIEALGMIRGIIGMATAMIDGLR